MMIHRVALHTDLDNMKYEIFFNTTNILARDVSKLLLHNESQLFSRLVRNGISGMDFDSLPAEFRQFPSRLRFLGDYFDNLSLRPTQVTGEIFLETLSCLMWHKERSFEALYLLALDSHVYWYWRDNQSVLSPASLRELKRVKNGIFFLHWFKRSTF